MFKLTFVLMDESDFKGYWAARLRYLLAPYNGILAECDCVNDGGEPEPSCRECSGNGCHYPKTTIWPEWDHWSIGVEFKGIFKDVETRFRWEDFPYGDEHKSVYDNCAWVSEIPEDLTPHAIITPDGEWLSPRVMIEDEEQWPDTAKSILAQHMDCIVLACYLHY